MKKVKRRLKKNVKVLLVLLLTVAVIFYVKSFNFGNKDKEKTSQYEYQNKVVINTKEELNNDIKKLIVDFYNVYFRSVKELKVYDTDKFFTKDSKDKALFKTALETLIESRKKQLNDLSLKNVSYDLKINKITTKDDVITIELLEDSYLDFNFLDKTSKVYNVLNRFKVVKENNEYKIKEYYKEQGFFIMIQNLIDEEEDYQNELDRIKKYYLTTFDNELESQKKLLQEYTDNKNKEFKKCDNPYDRKKAKEYALKYVTTREEGIDVYDTLGGNCQNFASRVLFAGGIPMDIVGTQQWKYYGGTINEKNTKVGRSTSWTGVGQFYAYAKTNMGFGLCSEVNVNSYYAEAGDLIQVGYKNKYRHTAVVVDTVKKDGNVIDVILNSNTGDLEQFPLSAYVYPEKRLIKVLGWNN